MNLFKTSVADFWSLALPIASAVVAVAAGVLAFKHQDDWAAILGIIGGLTGAGGVIATGQASRVRDDQMRFWIEAISDTQAHIREGFGS